MREREAHRTVATDVPAVVPMGAFLMAVPSGSAAAVSPGYDAGTPEFARLSASRRIIFVADSALGTSAHSESVCWFPPRDRPTEMDGIPRTTPTFASVDPV